MSRPDLALVVPCYNEASRLAPQAFLDFVSTHPRVWLLFVDDGSTDATGDVIERIKTSAPERIEVLRLPHRGKAEAVRAGILEGFNREASLVGFWDADLSTPLSAVDDFLAVALKRPELEIIMGSRVKLMGRDIRRQAWRHYFGRVFATAASGALALPVYDTQCGAKVFRATDRIAQVFATPFHSRWIFDVEVLSRFLLRPDASGLRPEFRIYELAVPVWHHHAGSKLRWYDVARAMFDLFGIRRRRSR